MKIAHLALLSLLACSTPRLQSSASGPASLVPPGGLRAPEGLPLAAFPDLKVTVRAPASATYDSSLFGPPQPSVRMRVVNTGPSRVDLPAFHAAFTALRDGVSFFCSPQSKSPPTEHEPSWLAPGMAYTFERTLDCTMPLPGSYQIRAYVTIGTQEAVQGQLVETFRFDVLPGTHPPKAYPSREGLYVSMAGDGLTRPLPPEAWARGDYSVLIALINATNRPLAVGAATLTLTTYKVGSSLPCAGNAEPITFADSIAKGAMLIAKAPVTCAPSEQGDYDIVGNLRLAGSDSNLVAGSIHLTVTKDPLLFAPSPRRWDKNLTGPALW